MISPNFGGSGHQIEMQFGSPHMGIVRQPPPTSAPPPQTNIHHNPPPWIKPVGNQQVEVEQSKLTNQDVGTCADTVQPIEEVKMDICDTWEQEKVQRLTEEVEKFEQEVMNIEKSSKAKEKGDAVTAVTIEPEKLAAKDDKSEKLTTEDNHKPEKLFGKGNALDKLSTEDKKLDELAVEDVKLEKETVEDDKKMNKLATTNIPVELAADIYKQTTETQSELKDDSMENLDDTTLDNEKEAMSSEANKNAKKPEDPKEEIPKELLMDDNKDFQKKNDGTSSKAALIADTKVDDIQQTDESNETEDKMDHMLKSKSDSGVLEQQPEGEEENKCDVKSEECHTDGDDAMDLQDSSSETNEPATGNA